jgi:hypothetical protein
MAKRKRDTPDWLNAMPKAVIERLQKKIAECNTALATPKFRTWRKIACYERDHGMAEGVGTTEKNSGHPQ